MKKKLLLFIMVHLLIAWVVTHRNNEIKQGESKGNDFSIDVSKKESPVLLTMSGKRGLSFN